MPCPPTKICSEKSSTNFLLRRGSKIITSRKRPYEKMYLNRRGRAYSAGHGKKSQSANNDVLVIAADGGYIYCLNLGIKPDVKIGDFDSWKKTPKHCFLVCLPN